MSAFTNKVVVVTGGNSGIGLASGNSRAGKIPAQRGLFMPVKVGLLELPNRIVMSRMTRIRASESCVPSERMVRYYSQRASAGLIITEGTHPSLMGRGYTYPPGLHTKEQAAGWRKVTDAVHAAGGRIFVQLMHAGRVSHSSLLPDHALPVAPSAGMSRSRRPAPWKRRLALRAASSRFRSVVYAHQGFFGSPAMYRTTAMNVSRRHGSWRWPKMRQWSSYIAYGSRPSNSADDVIPRRGRSPATAGPTLGMSSNRAIAFRLDGRVVDDFFIRFSHRIDRTRPTSTRSAAPLVAEARGLHT